MPYLSSLRGFHGRHDRHFTPHRIAETTDLTSLGLAALRQRFVTATSRRKPTLRRFAARPSACRAQRLHHHRRGRRASGREGRGQSTCGRIGSSPTRRAARVKDSYLTKGLPTSLGLDGLAHFVPREDADAVRAI